MTEVKELRKAGQHVHNWIQKQWVAAATKRQPEQTKGNDKALAVRADKWEKLGGPHRGGTDFCYAG
jgi:hypothetical protein